MPPTVVYFFIEGNIGATKSTLLTALADHLPHVQRTAAVVCVPEPVADWSVVLPLFYSDISRWALTFQVHAMSTRVAAVRRAIDAAAATHDTVCVVCERSVFTDRHVFVEMLHAGGHLTDAEHQMYVTAFDFYSQFMYPGRIGGVVYMDTAPDACLRRIRARGRPAEAGMTLEYLTALDAAHERALAHGAWGADVPVLRLPAERDVTAQLDAFMASCLCT